MSQSHVVSNSDIPTDSDIEVCIFIKTGNVVVGQPGEERRGPGQGGSLVGSFLGGSQASQSEWRLMGRQQDRD